MIPVIICGGFGTKMWPLSRRFNPKQFLPLIEGKSLFQLNYEALRTKFSPDEIYVSTNADQVELAKKQVPEISESNFIIEPEMRNQGPATGYIAAFLTMKGKENEPFMLVQVDDLREPVEKFIEMMEVCDKLARSENKYITGGFKPEFSVMGVDYLMKGERVTREGEVGVFKVKKYIWRDSKEDIEKLIKENDVLVHTNHTCMTPKNLLSMFEKYKPEWYGPLKNIIGGADLATEYSKMPEGPIEEVTEKVHAAGESLVVELPFAWTDFGTYESLEKYLKENNLYKVPETVIDLDGKDNYVNSDDPNKVIALVGVDNLVVVDTGDALLICDKKQTARVKEARKEVEKRKIALT